MFSFLCMLVCGAGVLLLFAMGALVCFVGMLVCGAGVLSFFRWKCCLPLTGTLFLRERCVLSMERCLVAGNVLILWL